MYYKYNKKIILSFVFALLMVILICTCQTSTVKAEDDIQLHYTGCIPDDEELIESKLLRSYSTYSNNQLPSYVDLTDQFPAPGNQGTQNSCTAWAVVYALKSHQEYVEWGEDHNWDLSNDNCQYSPTYIYNQENGGSNSGIAISSAMQRIVDEGVCSLNYMPYDTYMKDSECLKIQPVDYQKVMASNFKAKTWNTIRGLDAVRQRLNNNDGVVISIPVYKDFDILNNNNPTYDEISGDSRGRHAICIIGYDDTLQRFKIINSWGTDWGINGYGYISYDMFMNSNVSNGWGYVMEDAHQHYTDNPLRVLTNSAFKTYNDRGFKSVAHTFDNRYCVEISEFVDANCGNPPVFKIDSTYGYMSAQTDESKIPEYKVTYNSNGGSGTMSGSTIPYNVTGKLKKNTFTKTGYTFFGWHAKRSGGSMWLYKNYTTKETGWYLEGEQPSGYSKYTFSDEDSFSQLHYVDNGRVTFYAQWRANRYTIVYSPNGGEGALYTSHHKYDTNSNLKANQFTRTDYTFNGWYALNAVESKWFYKNYTTNESGWYLEGEQPSGYALYAFQDEESILNLTDINNSMVYLYAQWKPID